MKKNMQPGKIFLYSKALSKKQEKNISENWEDLEVRDAILTLYPDFQVRLPEVLLKRTTKEEVYKYHDKKPIKENFIRYLTINLILMIGALLILSRWAFWEILI